MALFSTFSRALFPVMLIYNHNYYFTARFGLEGSSPIAFREIRLNVSRVCSFFFKIWINSRRNQECSISERAEWLQKDINLRIKVITKTYET
jgi:hypothetical protein